MDIEAVARTPGLSTALPFFLTSLAAMVILAVLDFVGAVFAKEWADSRQPLWFVLGTLTFVGLFAFYAISLKTAELSIVTIGWVVFLQVGLVLYEHVRYGTILAPGKWLAICLILVLQAYLVLVPNESGQSTATQKPSSGAVVGEGTINGGPS